MLVVRRGSMHGYLLESGKLYDTDEHSSVRVHVDYTQQTTTMVVPVCQVVYSVNQSLLQPWWCVQAMQELRVRAVWRFIYRRDSYGAQTK